MFITAYAETFGYTGNGSYIYHVEQLSISSKIKVMSIQDKIDVLKSQLTGELGSNDKILIEINGLIIEQHKQDTLNRILK